MLNYCLRVKILNKNRDIFSKLIRFINTFSSKNSENINFSKKIILNSTFNRQIKELDLNFSPDNDNRLNLYSCGPTVYDYSHLGHAISYIRCDLFQRTFKIYLGKDINYAMNITDIDDKIIFRSNELKTDWKDLSEEYFQSFKSDMLSLNITEPDVYLKVTDKIDVISAYIRQIYERGFAYVSPESGDINFDYEKFIAAFRIKNEMKTPQGLPSQKLFGKRSHRDFALWKAYKSDKNEPRWECRLDKNTVIDGRPGWHVECSALSNYVFGPKLDIHFGGFDLIFPHHHCESCCSHAHSFELPDHHSAFPSTDELYSSANVWLHSGHLILRKEKMSKSLGNVIKIQDFLSKHHRNLLRLLCIRTHYRSEIDFDERMLAEMLAYDNQVKEFVSSIDMAIYLSIGNTRSGEVTDHDNLSGIYTSVTPLSQMIFNIENDIFSGVLQDLNLNNGLNSILKACKEFPDVLASQQNNDGRLGQLIYLRHVIDRWLISNGLDYKEKQTSNDAALNGDSYLNTIAALDHLRNFRQNIRTSVLDSLKILKVLEKSCSNSDLHGRKELLDSIRQRQLSLLDKCDSTRDFLEMRGIKIKDNAQSEKNNTFD